MMVSISSRHPALHVLLRGRETKLRSCCSECRGSPLQLSYFLAEVIQLFDACQLGRPRGAGAVLGRDMETDVKGGQEDGPRLWEEQSLGRWERGWRDWQRWVGKEWNACKTLADKTENSPKRAMRAKKAGERRGQERCRDKHSLQICLTKQKRQEGNSNTSQGYRGSKSSRECMDDKGQQRSLTPQCFLRAEALNAVRSLNRKTYFWRILQALKAVANCT